MLPPSLPSRRRTRTRFWSTHSPTSTGSMMILRLKTASTGFPPAPPPLLLPPCSAPPPSPRIFPLHTSDEDDDPGHATDGEPLSLIEAEMATFQPRDYLGSLPALPPVSLPKDSVLWAEFERVKTDPSSKLQGIGLARYEPAAPDGAAAKDPAAWKEALDRASTSLEHTNIRSVRSTPPVLRSLTSSLLVMRVPLDSVPFSAHTLARFSHWVPDSCTAGQRGSAESAWCQRLACVQHRSGGRECDTREEAGA